MENKVISTEYVKKNFRKISKIKEIFQNKRNQIFSYTYVDERQWQTFDKAIEIINELEKELLEEESEI